MDDDKELNSLKRKCAYFLSNKQLNKGMNKKKHHDRYEEEINNTLTKDLLSDSEDEEFAKKVDPVTKNTEDEIENSEDEPGEWAISSDNNNRIDVNLYESTFNVKNVKKYNKKEPIPRQDGVYWNKTASDSHKYFDKQWRENEEERIRILNDHPDVKFLKLVAGYANTEVTTLYSIDDEMYNELRGRFLQNQQWGLNVRRQIVELKEVLTELENSRRRARTRIETADKTMNSIDTFDTKLFKLYYKFISYATLHDIVELMPVDIAKSVNDYKKGKYNDYLTYFNDVVIFFIHNATKEGTKSDAVRYAELVDTIFDRVDFYTRSKNALSQVIAYFASKSLPSIDATNATTIIDAIKTQCKLDKTVLKELLNSIFMINEDAVLSIVNNILYEICDLQNVYYDSFRSNNAHRYSTFSKNQSFVLPWLKFQAIDSLAELSDIIANLSKKIYGAKEDVIDNPKLIELIDFGSELSAIINISDELMKTAKTTRLVLKNIDKTNQAGQVAMQTEINRFLRLNVGSDANSADTEILYSNLETYLTEFLIKYYSESSLYRSSYYGSIFTNYVEGPETSPIAAKIIKKAKDTTEEHLNPIFYLELNNNVIKNYCRKSKVKSKKKFEEIEKSMEKMKARLDELTVGDTNVKLRDIEYPYRQNHKWVSQPQHSGFVIIKEIVVAAIDNAYSKLKTWVDGTLPPSEVYVPFAEIPVNTLQRHPDIIGHFAKLVAACMAEADINFPKQYKLQIQRSHTILNIGDILTQFKTMRIKRKMNLDGTNAYIVSQDTSQLFPINMRQTTFL